MTESQTPRKPSSGNHFGRSLMVGAVLEVAFVGGLLWLGSQVPPPKPVIPQKKVIAIHMVQPTPPQPKPIPVPPPPKPVVQPKPKPVPVPKPIPIPKPVVHHTPPKPLLAKAPTPTAPVYTPPVVTPPAPPPPAPNPAVQQNAIDSYAAMLRARVQGDTRVPEAVRLMHTSGTAVIAFRLTPSGQLLSAHVAQSSGVGPIDRAALKAVENGNYPPFTKKMPKHDMTFDVRVHLSAHRG
ncbi:TonB family protein [Acidithiobacillus sulfuriphilus]|uniref:TonB family protein n=1 Tax=Acidithiobacillus sulfuriphilus TaxID=1867749 RepID=UPI003F638DCB